MYKHPDEIESISVDERTFSAEEIDGQIEIIHFAENGECVYRHNNKKYTIYLDLSKLNNGRAFARAKGHTFEIKVNTRIRRLIEELGFNKAAKTVDIEIHAPMPGLVLKTMVSEGDTVEEGQVLLTLEAMKMENIIKSPRSGIIKNMLVKNGDKVDKGDILIEFID